MVLAALLTRLVRRMLARALGPERDVEDSLQKSLFLCLFNKISGLRNPAALRAFIVSIAIRTLRHEIRRRKLRNWLRLDGNVAVEDVRAVNPDPDAREALIRFYALLDRISTRDRSVFVLHVIEGMDIEAIANALGVSVPTTRRCLTRARERMLLLAGRDPTLVDYVSRIRRGSAAVKPKSSLTPLSSEWSSSRASSAKRPMKSGSGSSWPRFRARHRSSQPGRAAPEICGGGARGSTLGTVALVGDARPKIGSAIASAMVLSVRATSSASNTRASRSRTRSRLELGNGARARIREVTAHGARVDLVDGDVSVDIVKAEGNAWFVQAGL